jgi:hypothetical protein
MREHLRLHGFHDVRAAKVDFLRCCRRLGCHADRLKLE